MVVHRTHPKGEAIIALFTDQDLPGNGPVTKLLKAALELSPAPVPYEVIWVDDWTQHLFSLLDEQRYDMGFPWIRRFRGRRFTW